MAEPPKLAAQVPEDRAILRRYAQAIAKSPLDIKRGEAVALDRRGRPIARARFKRIVRVWQVAMFAGMIAGGVLATSGALGPGALLYSLGAAPVFWGRWRGTGKLIAIDVIIRQGHLDEAQRRFDAVPHLARRNPVLYYYLAGTLVSNRGDYAAAISSWRKALGPSKGIMRERIKLSIVKALLLSGDVAEARLMFGDVHFPPEADEVVCSITLARTMFALIAPEEPPSEDELHDWARRALAYSHTGTELAALGWAFERSGDSDMARMLATEAVDRMHYPYLATWWPALQQWLDEHVTRADDPPAHT